MSSTVYVAGNIDDETENVPFNNREAARMFCVTEWEWTEERDSAEVPYEFKQCRVPELLTSMGEDFGRPEYEFLVIANGLANGDEDDGSYYFFIREDKVYDSTDEWHEEQRRLKEEDETHRKQVSGTADFLANEYEL
jgi:hypothetical protein